MIRGERGFGTDLSSFLPRAKIQKYKDTQKATPPHPRAARSIVNNSKHARARQNIEKTTKTFEHLIKTGKKARGNL